MNKVFLGIPSYSAQIHFNIMAAVTRASSKGQLALTQNSSRSWLTRNFNDLFCMALNDRDAIGITHFCMMHSDLFPTEADWLDKMLELMEAHHADVLSVVSPLKNKDGFTSTAIDTAVGKADPAFRVKRLTLTEIYRDFPPTFTHGKILLNTGLMLIKILRDETTERPWYEKLRFHMVDEIERTVITDPVLKTKRYRFKALGFPEDWQFSREARALGAKLYATREIKLVHVGPTPYANDHAWGLKKEDA